MMQPVAYPPPGHFLRHLRIEADTTVAGRSVGRLPALPDLCGADGTIRLGALAAALDVTAGTLAVSAVFPDWTATTHLSVQTATGISTGAAVITCRVLRAGRSSVFIGAELSDEAGAPVGSATIGFQRLVRRDGNPTAAGAPEGTVTHLGDGEPDGPRPPLTDFLGLRTVDPAAVELDLAPHIANSTGTVQGGVVATLLEAAAAAGAGRVADLEIHYLAAGKTGPFRARAFPVRPGTVRLELRDAGADDRLLSTGVATVLI
jgi:acyl-coenzyme A thioesterase PaaI-like protein